MKLEKHNAMAVFFDANDRISSFDTMTHWDLFYKKKDSWQKSKAVPYTPSLMGELGTIRENIKQMIAEFEDCRIIITRSMTGIPYHTFDKARFIICEVESFDLELLDAIQQDLISTAVEAAKQKPPEAPTETNSPGDFFFNLNQLQKNAPEISSKMALLPFFKNVPFLSLDLVCEHVPPWFDKIFDSLNLTYAMDQKNDGKTHVLITHTNCQK
ncbi:Fe-only nitrogenase accessory AnfO family protein [Acetobacterium bakii]|uniref:Fe-only nitrogenase accessory protein AnfO n=1 Tax=Acetobacterium bakii TaxID=52689 RepID=A0A0L6U0F2_9FIRM|nr:Fe-only nitrogenase accessory AnfO family protein [Acetobacterium bakii]KNZ41973.1 hypothetical protein AKG39_10215 [Acetobacterium bakii]